MDNACKYWYGDSKPERKDNYSQTRWFGGEARLVSEARCIVCRPYTDNEANRLLGYEPEVVSPKEITVDEPLGKSTDRKYLGWSESLNNLDIEVDHLLDSVRINLPIARVHTGSTDIDVPDFEETYYERRRC
jgi:hypothetical protein